MPTEHIEKIKSHMADMFSAMESFFSYLLGFAGMILPNVMPFATSFLQFVTMVAGAAIVVFRVIHEYRNFKKNK